jgi:hypothetical protein
LRANSTNKRETTKSVENGSDFSPAPAVTVTGKKSVAPAKNRCTLATFYLHYITFYYNQKLLLYRAPDGCFLDAVERMTAVLADALHVFYLAMATRSRAASGRTPMGRWPWKRTRASRGSPANRAGVSSVQSQEST